MNITILPKGKEKKHHAIIKDAVCFFINKLISKKDQKKINNIFIRLADSVNYGTEQGNCREFSYTDGTFDIFVKVLAKDPLPDMISTLAHEMVHAKQAVTGELICTEDFWVWHGKRLKYKHEWYNVFTSEEQYDKLPWETEAYDLESELARSFFWKYFSKSYSGEKVK